MCVGRYSRCCVVARVSFSEIPCGKCLLFCCLTARNNLLPPSVLYRLLIKVDGASE